MALLGKEKFSPSRMETLRQYLETYAQRGEAIEYEILLDGSKVVQRTSEPQLFDLYESLVTADTRVLEVIFYRGKSNHNDRRIFTFGDLPAGGELYGTDVRTEVKKQVEAARNEWVQEQVKTENEALKEKIEELVDEIEELEEELEEIKSKQSPFNGVLGEIGSNVIESFLRKNPKILNSIPLSGLLSENTSAPNGENKSEEKTFEPEVSYKAQGAKEDEKVKLNDEQKAAMDFLVQLRNAFTPIEFKKAVQILQGLLDDKSRIDIVLNLFEPPKQ